MKSVKAYNALNGKTVKREKLIAILKQATTEGQQKIVNKLTQVLDTHSNKVFTVTISQKITAQSGLGAPRHKGMAKEALDECGRLKPGYKYVKGGKIEKVEKKRNPKKKETKTLKYDFENDQMVFIAFSKTKKNKIEVEYKINQHGGYYSYKGNGSSGSVNTKTDIVKIIKRELDYLGKGYIVRVDKLNIVPKSKLPLKPKTENDKKFISAYNQAQEEGALTFEQNEDKAFVNYFFKEIYNRKLRSKKIFLGNLNNALVFDISDIKKSKAPKLKPGIQSLKNIVSKDDLRPVMSGVYTDNGNLVATNAHVLVLLKGLGKKADNGKILNTFNVVKTGRKYIDGTYPKYKNVIPTYNNKTAFIDIDVILNDVYTFTKLVRPIKTNGLNPRYAIIDSGKLMVYDVVYLLEALKALKANGTKKIRYAGNKSRALNIETDNDHFALVMPVFTGTDDIEDLDVVVNKPINYSNKGFNEIAGRGLKGANQNTLFSNLKTKPLGKPKTIDVSEQLGLPGPEQHTTLVSEVANPEGTPAANVLKEVSQQAAAPSTKTEPKPTTKQKGVLNSSDLMNMSFDSLNFTGDWANFMQEPAKNMRIAIWGKPKNGKTAGATTLANYLTNFGNVLYNFADQGFNKSTKDLWQLSGLANKPNAFAVDTRDLNELDKLCASGKYDFVFIDMINTFIHRTGIKYHEFEDRFLKKYPNISFILIFEVTKSGDFKGDQGWTHLVDAVVTVENFVMENQGRYGVGHYIVWKEGLQKTNPKKYEQYFEEETTTTNLPTEMTVDI